VGQKGFGKCLQRDEGGRSVEVAHIIQRIKELKGSLKVMRRNTMTLNHHCPESDTQRCHQWRSYKMASLSMH